MKDTWKIIPETYGKYRIDTSGDAWSKKKNGWKKLKPQKRGKYLKVTLSVDNVKHQVALHILVARAFVDNPYNLPFVNHKDENPLNNCVDNLEWCDHQYNCNYGTRNERIKKSQLNDPKKSVPVDVYTSTGAFVDRFPSISEAARYLKTTPTRVSQCCLGNRHSTKNHICRYANPN